jgi:hypothetical protein
MDGGSKQTPGNAYPAVLLLVGATAAILFMARNELRERFAYMSPVEEAQIAVRKAIGIEDDE